MYNTILYNVYMEMHFPIQTRPYVLFIQLVDNTLAGLLQSPGFIINNGAKTLFALLSLDSWQKTGIVVSKVSERLFSQHGFSFTNVVEDLCTQNKMEKNVRHLFFFTSASLKLTTLQKDEQEKSCFENSPHTWNFKQPLFSLTNGLFFF